MDRAVSDSREVARSNEIKDNIVSVYQEVARTKKTHEQAMSIEDGTMSPENEGHVHT